MLSRSIDIYQISVVRQSVFNTAGPTHLENVLELVESGIKTKTFCPISNDFCDSGSSYNLPGDGNSRERHDRNSGRRPVGSGLFSFISQASSGI